MLQELAQSLSPIIFVMVGVMVTALWVFLKSSVPVTAKMLLTPLTIAAALAVPLMFIALMGYAVRLPLPDKLDVIAHRTVIDKNKKTKIEVWVREKNATRLYTTPYNKELEKALEEARKGRNATGAESRLHRRDPSKPEWDLEMRTPDKVMPKDEPEDQPEGEPDQPRYDRIPSPNDRIQPFGNRPPMTT